MCGRKSNNNLCAVCESPNAISQFGAITCRACGAFFRRLALNDRQYDCDCEVRLRGKPESEIARKRRIANCRGCRLRRCLGAGMTREGCKNGSMQYFQSAEDAYGINFTRKLLEIEAKARRIYFNVVGFPAQTLSNFETLEQLLQCNDNLLAHSENYPAIKLEPFDKERFEEIITKAGLWSYEPCTFIKHLLISINIAKILPVFSRLDLPDKVAAVNVFVLSATNFIERYHSMRCNAEAGMIENINYPLFLLYTKSTNSDEPIIRNLAEAVFNLPMRNFLQTFPSREEFVLILALLFTNSANPSLSENGQRIMNEESEKCAKTLLRLQQRQFGEQGGAIRYSECLQLLWNTIYTTQKHKELIVYIDTVYEQGKFEAVMPKILAPLVIGRKNAIEIDDVSSFAHSTINYCAFLSSTTNRIDLKKDAHILTFFPAFAPILYILSPASTIHSIKEVHLRRIWLCLLNDTPQPSL